MSNRRGPEDKEWQEVKSIVRERDNNSCRLCRCLSIKEFLILKKNAGNFLFTIDPAHYIPVSERLDLTYCSFNICCLNRYSHSCLDSFKSPIDGRSITSKEVNDWWIRILKTNEEQYQYLLENNLIKER